MNTQLALRNLKLYLVFWLLREPLFWGPILIIFIQSASKMSLSEVYFMESACIIVAIILQVPTGALADLIGRKITMMIGVFLLIIMMIMFCSATTKLEMWLSNIVAFIGYSFISGADKALLYDSLLYLGREKEHRYLLGRFSGYSFLLSAGCSIICGWLAEVDLRLPLYLCLPPLVFNFALIWFFTEPPRQGERQGPDKRQKFSDYFLLMSKSVLFVANHRPVKWTIAFIAVVSVAGKLWFFSYNPYFQLVGLDLSSFGYIFCGLNLVAAVCSYQTQKIHDCLGDVGSQLAILSCLFLPIVLMGTFVLPMMAWLVVAQNFVRGYFNPFMTDFLNRHLDSENRATVLSIGSAVSEASQLVALLGFGFLLQTCQLATCLQILGVTVLVLGAFLLLMYFRIFKARAAAA